MNLSILNAKKSQLKNASKDASVSTIEAPAKKPDYTGVPEAEAQAEAIKEQKKAATTKARAERKAAAKKSAKAEPKPIKPKAEVTEPVKPKSIKPSAKKEPTKKTTPKFTIVDYSEKCVALFGDTKPIKDDLKAMGGRFNANLRPFDDDTRVPGWVFPKKCKDDLMKLIK